MDPQQKDAIVQVVNDTLAASLGPALKSALGSSTEIRQLKRKSKVTPDFNRKGNKLRYEANQAVLEKIEESLEAIGEQHLQTAADTLFEGKSLLSKQQKLIRIADRESDGWEVVRHYLSDDLAEDSADEKCIQKARKSAKVTKKERFDKKRNDSKRERFRNAPRGARRSNYDRGYNRFQGRGESSKPYETDGGPRHTHKSTICYNCGNLGHFQSFCPNKFRR